MLAVIRTYGVLWDNTLVDWTGKRGPGGFPFQLLGSTKQRETTQTGCVDFTSQIGMSALYDEREQVIYIGQSGSGRNRLGKRLRSHLSDELMGRWRYFSWFGLGWVPKRSNKLSTTFKSYTIANLAQLLDPIEGMLINLVEPKLNLQRGNLSKHNVERYYQFGQYAKWLNLKYDDGEESAS